MTRTDQGNPMDLHEAVSERDHVRGDLAAKVQLVEYGDFDCPFCARAYPVVRELLRRFSDSLCFVFRHNPRGELHPNARLAAEAAECAALQGQFWGMHDLLFEHPKSLEESALIGYAEVLKLDLDRFRRELRSPPVVARVREDEVGGLRSGVVGTPTFFINGVHFRDKPDVEVLAKAIADAAQQTRSSPSSSKSRAASAGARATKSAPFRRRDATGHLDPSYQAFLLEESGRNRTTDEDRAFLGHARSSDPLAEQLGEEFIGSATSGQYDAEDARDQVVPEESGGPFIETGGDTEFAEGTDESNIEGATREPFPKT